MYFCYFVIIFPKKRAWPFIWTNLNLLHPRMLCAKFGWNWPSGFWRRGFFLNSVNVFSLFRNYLPLEKGEALHPRMLFAKFGWNWTSGSGEEDENVKSLRHWQRQRRRRSTDKFWSEELTWAFGSGELKRSSTKRF